MSVENPVKKDVKNALKFLMNAPGAACPTCRKEIQSLLLQIGKDWSDNVEGTYTINLKGGHFCVYTDSVEHQVMPEIPEDIGTVEREKARRAARREKRKAAALAKAAEEAQEAGVETVAEEESEDSE